MTRMEITFLGGTGTVTGSKYLLRSGSAALLVDCGLFQGLKALRLRNWAPPPVRPKDVDAMVLTHAHLDHSGYLPRFIKQGFAGPVHASPGTRDLCAILLPDSGHLQEEEARYANKRGFSKHKPALPLYTADDARASLKRFAPVPFRKEAALAGEFHLTLQPAGHILGASIATLRAGGVRVVFSGDLGRMNDPEQADPEETLGSHLNRAPWKDRTPVLLDDIISSARTMALAAKKIREAGLDAPVCVGVHGIFSPDALGALRDAGAARIVTTNTIAHETNAIDVTAIVARGVQSAHKEIRNAIHIR